MLDAAGVHQVQGGYPGRSDVYYQFVREFNKRRQKIKIKLSPRFSRETRREQITVAWSAVPTFSTHLSQFRSASYPCAKN